MADRSSLALQYLLAQPALTIKLFRYSWIQYLLIVNITIVYLCVSIFRPREFFTSDNNETDITTMILYRYEYYTNTPTSFYYVLLGCKITSFFASIVTVTVYIYLPQLRSQLHGKMVIFYMVSTAVSYLSVSFYLSKDYVDFIPRKVSYYSWMLVNVSLAYTTVWLTVMGFETWARFNRPVKLLLPGTTHEQRRPWRLFLAYAMQVAGYSLFVLVSTDSDYYFMNLCFFFVLNLMISISIAVNLRAHFSDTVGKHLLRLFNKKTHGSVFVYHKLVLVAAVGFAGLVTASVLPDKQSTVYFVCESIYSLNGVLTLVVLVCNRQVIRLFVNKNSEKDSSNYFQMV